MKKYSVIIVGGGPSGLMCAIESGKRRRSVLVLDHNEKIGRKIIISGGGRCNFTNLNISKNNYISQNNNFCISALSRFGTKEMTDFLTRNKIRFYEKEKGRLFCERDSGQILDLLRDECNFYNVDFQLKTEIEKIEKNSEFLVHTNQGVFSCESLVIATGGISYPVLGSSDFGYKIAKQFGLKILERKPGLVPFVFLNKEMNELTGISAEVSVSIGKTAFLDNLLFTHKGLSGPAILQISSYWARGEKILIDFLPRIREELEGIPNIKSHLSKLLPSRLVNFILKSSGIVEHSKKLNKKDALVLNSFLHSFELQPIDTEGFQKAEVTIGGICTKEISSKTFECEKCKGLYFSGEVLDVAGQLGGYNMHWAFASGFATGQYC